MVLNRGYLRYIRGWLGGLGSGALCLRMWVQGRGYLLRVSPDRSGSGDLGANAPSHQKQQHARDLTNCTYPENPISLTYGIYLK